MTLPARDTGKEPKCTPPERIDEKVNEFLAIVCYTDSSATLARKVSILRNDTVSNPARPDLPAEPEASLRAELIGRLAGAQLALEKVIADLARNGSSTSTANSQLSLLAGLQASIGTASSATLAAMSGEVAAAVAETKAIADQARGEIASNAAASALALASAASASRTAITDAMDTLRHTALTFASPEDERAYREREEETRRYITTQQSKHTPEGDLNASGAAVGQMVDAKAHGASGSEFDRHFDALVATHEQLREAAKANGVSTEESDRRLHDDLRRVMKSKGLSDAQIDAQFAANPNPLEAAKAFTQSDVVATQPASTPRATAQSTSADAKGLDDMASLVASLQSSGVVARPHDPEAEPEHGVAAAAVATSARTV